MGMLTEVRSSLTRHDQLTREARASLTRLEAEVSDTAVYVRVACVAIYCGIMVWLITPLLKDLGTSVREVLAEMKTP